MSADPSSLPSFPMPRECPFDPPAAYGEFQKQPGASQVKMWDGSKAWVFSRYDDVKAVLADNRFSGDPFSKGFPSLSPARNAVLDLEPAFIRMDPPEHGRFRRMLTKEFMVKKVADMRPHIDKLCDDLIDNLLAKGPPAELNNDMFLPLTSNVVSDMLGVPYEDHDFFQEQSMRKVLLDCDPAIPVEASRLILEYLDKLITEKKKNPNKDDMLGRLIIEQLQPGHLSHRELVVMADLLLMAGHETTANQMALGVYSFLTNPEQLRIIKEDPTKIRGAVDEMLRFHTIVHYNAFRSATEDIEINGTQIKKGESVIALIAAANRDPAAFECPNDFDVSRKSDHHVAFSFGIHQCLGQPLARAELHTVMSKLFTRIPTLKFAVPVEEIKTKGDHFVLGLQALPVSW
jgi:cytochrome P450